jgi:5-methylcytosine-specific restriction endonuclease McrA
VQNAQQAIPGWGACFVSLMLSGRFPVIPSWVERLSFQTEPLMTKSLARSRAKAYARQFGRCFYCDFPMWTDDAREFASTHGITLAQAGGLQCTAEHLEARQDGGSDSPSNIVAACRRCNQGRHSRKEGLSPDHFKQFVRKRMSQGRWHDRLMLQRLMNWPHRRNGTNQLNAV